MIVAFLLGLAVELRTVAPRPSRIVPALLLALALTGCAGWRTPPASQLLASVANRAAPALVAIETAQGDAAIAAHPGDPKATAPVEAAWAPFWLAWSLFTDAQAKAAASREHGASDAEQLEALAASALCGARALMPVGAPAALLEVEGMACAMAPAVKGATK